MKKYLVPILSSLCLYFFLTNADAKTTTFDGKGEVVTVDPLYDRITIKHGAIKGFAGDEQTEFTTKSKELLKGLSKHDLVDFTLEDNKGNTQLIKISKTGAAPPPDESLPIGKAVQDVLVATGEATKTVTTPIEPAHEVVSGAFGATTDATGTVLKDVKSDVKQKF